MQLLFVPTGTDKGLKALKDLPATSLIKNSPVASAADKNVAE